jgi:predicted ribosome quality control (RQC) complex YloA/Tae2 family protein
MHEIAAALVGARIQRIDGPFDGVFALTLHRSDRHGCLLLSVDPRGAAWGWRADRPRGAPASSFVLLLRKHLEDETITSVDVGDTIEIVCPTGALRLHARPANLVLSVGGVEHPLFRSPLERRVVPFANDLRALERAGETIVREQETARISAIARGISRHRAKLVRRLGAIADDRAKADRAPAFRADASLILANMRQIPPGASEAIVTDWSVDPPAERAIAIDPKHGPARQAEALFTRAKKLERGAAIALERHQSTEREIAALDDLSARLAAANADIDALEREAARLGAKPQAKVAPREIAAARRPFRTFRGANDRAIWVGRSAADNDTLTMKIARPHHHWLHARGGAGAHVIVPLDRGEDCPSELLIDAAHLAAHFSALRDESPIEIAHATRRHVRKPRGAAVGMVSVSQEKTIVLRVEPDRLARLLAGEDHG